MDCDKAYRISTAGNVCVISPANGKDFQLEEAQKIVGGHIEVVHLTPNIIAIVDEEGKIKGKEPNPLATIIVNSAGGIWHNDYIAGEMIICPAQMLP